MQELNNVGHQLALDLALGEASQYHPGPVRPGFPYITLNWRESAQPARADASPARRYLKQRAIPVDRMDWAVRQIFTRPDWQGEHWFISQSEFNRPNRQKIHVWSLGGCWVDIDLKSPSHDERTRSTWCSAVLMHCADLGIPEPTLIIWSGHGLHVKWVFDKPVPSAALPRWNALQRHLHAKLHSVQLPSDPKALDASRILRIAGTYNNTAPVLVIHQGPAHALDVFAEHVLPYTREDVQQFREDEKARQEAAKARRAAWDAAGKAWAQWSANKAAAAAFLRQTTSFSPIAFAAREAAETLHYRRLQALRSIAQARGGIQSGQRNEWCWIVANSAAYGLGDPNHLWGELASLMREIAPSYTAAEARSSASSVYTRLKEGKDALYKLKTSTILERLEITDDEARRHGLLDAGHRAHGTKNPGAMGLKPLKGLSFERWQKEVRKRWAMGGQRTGSTVRNQAEIAAAGGVASGQARAQASEENRATARLMRAQGMSTRQIGAELGVEHSTVVRWLAD